jgi:hypothetical protein
MALFGWFKKAQPASSDAPRSFRLEWSGFATPPADGDRRGVSWPEVEAVLQRFASEPSGSDAFFILGISELTYLQAAWEDGSITLEHQQGSLDHHFVCTQPVDAALLMELARLYVDRPESVAGMAAWERLDM